MTIEAADDNKAEIKKETYPYSSKHLVKMMNIGDSGAFEV